MSYGRRTFLGSLAVAGPAAFAAKSALAANNRPRLGVVADANVEGGPDRALAMVHEFGLPTCQLAVGLAPMSLANPIREASSKYGIEITALMTLGSGRMVWTLRDGPHTIGLVPRDTRQSRIDALKKASDLAKACGLKAVHTHCGFIPEVPSDPLYRETVDAMHEVVSYCGQNGQTFLCETGQESPITLLRAIEDVGLSNIAVNLDVANLILYGKGEPVGALDVLGKYVRGMHAKDGLYPTDPYGLGEEVPIGRGKVRFAEVFRKLKELSYAGPVTIEREISGPRQQSDIRASKTYLEEVIAREYGA